MRWSIPELVRNMRDEAKSLTSGDEKFKEILEAQRKVERAFGLKERE